MNSKRLSNYDMLRFLAMLGVIINHVSDVFVLENGPYLLITYIWEGIGAFAVPAFLMITGAFTIDSSKSIDAKSFYKKFFGKIGTQTIIFSFFYFVSWTTLYLLQGYGFVEAIKIPLIWQLKGWAGHPLWYVYTLLGIYLLIPIIANIRAIYGNTKIYHFGALLYCLWAFISLYFDGGTLLSWSINKVFCFLGFVILGSEIKFFLENHGNNFVSCMVLLSGFLVYVLEYVILYFKVQSGGNYYIPYLNSHVAPLSLIGISLIFSGTVMLKMKTPFKITVRYSFYIYLIHRIVLDVLRIVLQYAKVSFLNDCRIYIPLVVVFTFVISLLGAIIYEKIFKIIKDIIYRKNNII